MKSSRLSPILVVVLAVACLLASAVYAQGPAPVPASQPASAPADAAKIKDLVTKLGDGDFRVRDDAQKQLSEIGVPALEEIQKAAKSEDMEVRQRAEALVAEISAAIAKLQSEKIAKNLLWSLTVAEGVTGSPAVSNGVVCAVTTQRKLVAADAKTGKELWKFEDFAQGQMPLNPPVANDKTVVVSDPENGLVAVDLANGKLRWKVDKPGAGNQAPANPGFGAMAPAGLQLSQAAIDKDLVYVCDSGGTLQAIDAATGKVKWKSQITSVGLIQPVLEAGIVCAAGSETIDMLDAATGKTLWSGKPKSPTGLVLAEGKACYITEDNLIALDAKTGKELWKTELPKSANAAAPAVGPGMAPGVVVAINGRLQVAQANHEPPIVSGGALHLIREGELIAVNLKDGKKKWDYKLELSQPEANGPVNVNGPAIINGQVILNGAQGQALQMRIGFGPGGPIFGGDTGGQLAIGEAAYILRPDGLHAVDLKTGKELWCYKATMISGRPVLVDGVLYFGTQVDPMAAFRARMAGGAQPKQGQDAGLFAFKVKMDK